MLCHAYVINLALSPQRLAHARAELAKLGLALNRVDAFDGRQLAATDFAEYDAERALTYMGRALSPGELGCYLSHCRALETFLATDENIALVFEDDVRVSDATSSVLKSVLDWLAAHPALRWQAVNLGPNRRKFTTTLGRFGTHEIARGHYFPQLAHAILWNRTGARAFLDQAKPIFCPADTMIRHIMIRSNQGLAVYPPIAWTGAFDSDIAARSGSKRAQYGRLRSYGWRKQKRLWIDKALAMRNQILAPHGRRA
ncbi:MAG: glycosyltransferase family 25 protein [Rhodobacteraceae bacterium]|nr:glycosyltransferase family 25 protein [Paracoccaceae bacterium]